MRLIVVALCISCMCLASCISMPTNQPPKEVVRSRVTPMKYDQWQFQTFDYIGLKANLPNVACTSPSAKGEATLTISMHYLSPVPGVLDDATVFVHVYVERIPVSKMAEELEYQKAGRSEESKKYWNWYYELHPIADRYEKGQHAYYRRDVKLNEKEILHAHAEVLNAGPKESRDADHAAVKRILDSIQPLNAATKAVSNVTTNK